MNGDRGLKGERGEQGLQGVIGERGEPGLRGEQGIQGERGYQGEQGIQGIAGERGERGDNGAAGAQGERGIEGSRGKLPSVRAWTDRIHYEGDVVVHGGGTYQAKCDTAKMPGHDDWLVLAAPGVDGKDGRDGINGKSFRVRDTYGSTVIDYQALDIVTLNSTWFIAKKDNPGQCPGPDWKAGPVGKQGKPGEKGAQGIAGIKGVQGDKGAPGLEIVGWKLDKYTAIPVMSDGSEGPALQARALFEQYDADRSGGN